MDCYGGAEVVQRWLKDAHKAVRYGLLSGEVRPAFSNCFILGSDGKKKGWTSDQ